MYTEGGRRMKHQVDKGWPAPDAMFDPHFEWGAVKFVGKYRKLYMSPDLRSTAFPEGLRRDACDTYGYEDPRLAFGTDRDIRRRHLFATNSVLPEHRDDEDSILRLYAVRKYGVLESHRDDNHDRIRLRHRIKYGFTTAESTSPYAMTKLLQSWYLRKHGVNSPQWLTCTNLHADIKARLRRGVDSSGVAPGAKEVNRVCDLLLRADYSIIDAASKELFGLDPKCEKNPYLRHLDAELAFFLVAAVETIAAHPEFSQELEMFLGPVHEGKRKRVFLNAISYIQQNAEGILAARDRRMLGLRSGGGSTAAVEEEEDDE
jgi:hypothetical protein